MIIGYKRFSDDIQTMIGTRPSYYWVICWTFLTPMTLGVSIPTSWLGPLYRLFPTHLKLAEENVQMNV